MFQIMNQIKTESILFCNSYCRVHEMAQIKWPKLRAIFLKRISPDCQADVNHADCRAGKPINISETNTCATEERPT